MPWACPRLGACLLEAILEVRKRRGGALGLSLAGYLPARASQRLFWWGAALVRLISERDREGCPGQSLLRCLPRGCLGVSLAGCLPARASPRLFWWGAALAGLIGEREGGCRGLSLAGCLLARASQSCSGEAPHWYDF